MNAPVDPLWRRAAAEAIGTGLLVTVVVGSGIAASSLSKGDVGLQLLENAFATALGLAVLILALGPVSGAHFNPVVSLVDWWLGRANGTGLGGRDLAAYLPAQLGGGVAGAVVANLMFGEAAVSWSTTHRSAGHSATPSQVSLPDQSSRSSLSSWSAASWAPGSSPCYIPTPAVPPTTSSPHTHTATGASS